ncbi:ArnT family glycosyltransferase [Dyella soli]|uniref:Glycosyl transferase n=1 Tax=Dyella soli TaxID=522319 RepID=A0A4R0YN88_9GAMM|nr:glycosyltransferase family 39 protein [Dyella soli]TCI07279.1 glycosyl transferase [Dyella soli]
MISWSRVRDGLGASPALVMLLLLPLLAVLPPVPIDETRYLSVAWEMRQGGDWVTLHLNGLPYFDKPPLLFWLLNLCWSVLGVSLWSARALMLLCGAGCVALCQRIERRLSPEASGEAAWLLLGILFFTLFSSVVMFDILLCLCVLLGFLAVVESTQTGGRRALLMLFVASALGVLAKGPVIFLHLAAPMLAARWWHGGVPPLPWRRVGAMLLVVLLGGLPALLWAWAAVHDLSAQDASNLLLRQTTGRVVESFAHNRPFWWYLPWLPVLVLPWPVLARWRRLGSAFATWRQSRAVRFGATASIPTLVAFCLVSGKQLHYLLPLLPGVAIVFGAWVRQDPALLSMRRWWVLVVLWLGLLLWAMVGTEPVGRGHMQHSVATWLYLLSGVLIVAAVLYMLRSRQPRVERRTALGTLLLVMALLPLIHLQALGALDLAVIAQKVSGLQVRGVPVARTGNDPGLVTFLARLPEPLTEVADPAQWARQNPDGVLLVYSGRGVAPAGASDTVRLANGWAGLMSSQAVLADPGEDALVPRPRQP